jgi:predicted house-cleaning NTP pyrophosphatase (Maf/HAM1 superfamily)
MSNDPVAAAAANPLIVAADRVLAVDGLIVRKPQS